MGMSHVLKLLGKSPVPDLASSDFKVAIQTIYHYVADTKELLNKKYYSYMLLLNDTNC